MRRDVIAGGLALAALGAAALAEPEVGPNPASSAVDRLLARFSEGRRPGVAAAVVRDGVVVHATGHGYRNLARGERIDPDTRFRLASVSKQLTAMAIVRLAERGALGYDDSAMRWLPELGRYGGEITVRHLLTHTAGLPDYYDQLIEKGGYERPTNEGAAAFLASWGGPRFPAGARHEYSNPGYEMLSLIAERASGVRFAELMRLEVFEPAGMASALVVDCRQGAFDRRAFGYSRDGHGYYRLHDDDPLNCIVGSGGVYATLRDMIRWDAALSAGRLVEEATLAEIFSPARTRAGEAIPYGFGWRLQDFDGSHRAARHGGGWVGFRTAIVRLLDGGSSAVVLSNAADTEAETLADALVRIYLGR